MLQGDTAMLQWGHCCSPAMTHSMLQQGHPREQLPQDNAGGKSEFLKPSSPLLKAYIHQYIVPGITNKDLELGLLH